MNEIANFAKESNFENFYESHVAYYESCIQNAKSKIDQKQIPHFQQFFKEDENRRYVVNLLPLCSRNGTFYDIRFDDKIVANISNNQQGNFDELGENMAGRLFNIYALCKIMKIVEDENIVVPRAKDFEKVMKSEYTAGDNLQYIATEIAHVMRTSFKKMFCPEFLEIDPSLVENELTMFKNSGRTHVFEIYDLLLEWQNSNEPLKNWLQRMFDLFK